MTVTDYETDSQGSFLLPATGGGSFFFCSNISTQICRMPGLVRKIKKAVLNQQNSDGSQVNKGEKRSVQLVISGGNSAKPFELLEEALKQMALFI
ncbi:hypothetical protein AALA54_11695 [Oscillospiraceae bacterium 44-34]